MRKKVKEKRPYKGLWILSICLIAVLIAIIYTFFPVKNPAVPSQSHETARTNKLNLTEQKNLGELRIDPKDYVMTSEEANKYIVENVSPVIVKYANDPNALPAMKDRLNTLFRDYFPAKINYAATPGYYPLGKTYMAKIDYDPREDKLVLHAFVPAIRDGINEMRASGDTQDQIDDYIATIYAHEMIHLENESKAEILEHSGVQTPVKIFSKARSEAKAWCQTIVEIIRPLEVQDRKPNSKMLEMSEKLKRAGNDCSQAAWINAFINY